MGTRQRYRKKATSFVTAVRLDLDTDGFSYRKWGGDQVCKPGDWVVDNDGDVYSVDAAVFERTYEQRSPGVYVKTEPIWAEVTEQAGSVKTKEGVTHYRAGDYLVSNNEDESDTYAISAEKFASLYELDS